MHKDITTWCKLHVPRLSSDQPRSANIPALPCNFKEPDCRFDHLHVDIVALSGLYLSLHCIDRFTRWTEAIAHDGFNCTNMCQGAFLWVDLQIWFTR